MVLRYALSRVHDQVLAEDLAGETFERALRGWARFGRRSEATTWIIGIARHVIADYWRRQRGQSVSLESLPHDVAEDCPSIEDEVAHEEDLLEMRRALAALPEAERDVLALRYAACLSTADIAEVLHVRHGTARVRLHRARERVRALLQSAEP